MAAVGDEVNLPSADPCPAYAQTRALLAYLEASRYKLQVALAELEGQPRPQHPLRKHIEYHKDRQGMTQTILKVRR